MRLVQLAQLWNLKRIGTHSPSLQPSLKIQVVFKNFKLAVVFHIHKPSPTKDTDQEQLSTLARAEVS